MRTRLPGTVSQTRFTWILVRNRTLGSHARAMIQRAAASAGSHCSGFNPRATRTWLASANNCSALLRSAWLLPTCKSAPKHRKPAPTTPFVQAEKPQWLRWRLERS